MSDRPDDRKGCIGPPLAVASITTSPTLSLSSSFRPRVLPPPPSPAVCGAGRGLASDRASACPQPDVRSLSQSGLLSTELAGDV